MGLKSPEKMSNARNFIGLAVIAVLAACGGGGGGGSSTPSTSVAPKVAPTTAPTTTAGQSTARFSITVPQKTSTASTRRGVQYIDPNTQSISVSVLSVNGVAVAGPNAGPITLAYGAPGCTPAGPPPPLACSFSFPAPVGNDVFLTTSYSDPLGTVQLGSGAVLLSILPNSINQANLTLTGPIQSIALASNNSTNFDTLWNGNGVNYPLSYSQYQGYQSSYNAPQVGPTPPGGILSERVFVVASDVNGNQIINPTTYNQPIMLTLLQNGGPANALLTDTPPAGFGSASTANANGQSVAVQSPSDVITLAIIPATIPALFSPPVSNYSYWSTYANFPSLTASLGAPPGGFVQVQFPFTIEAVPGSLPPLPYYTTAGVTLTTTPYFSPGSSIDLAPGGSSVTVTLNDTAAPGPVTVTLGAACAPYVSVAPGSVTLSGNTGTFTLSPVPLAVPPAGGGASCTMTLSDGVSTFIPFPVSLTSVAITGTAKARR